MAWVGVVEVVKEWLIQVLLYHREIEITERVILALIDFHQYARDRKMVGRGVNCFG